MGPPVRYLPHRGPPARPTPTTPVLPSGPARLTPSLTPPYHPTGPEGVPYVPGDCDTVSYTLSCLLFRVQGRGLRVGWDPATGRWGWYPHADLTVKLYNINNRLSPVTRWALRERTSNQPIDIKYSSHGSHPHIGNEQGDAPVGLSENTPGVDFRTPQSESHTPTCLKPIRPRQSAITPISRRPKSS